MTDILLTLFFAASAMAVETSQKIFAQNSTQVVFSSTLSNVGGASDWMSVPSEQFFCGTGCASTAFQGASASLNFTGTAITLKLYADVQGSTAQILLDGVKQQQINLAGTADYYFNCTTTEWTSPVLSNGEHSVTIMKDEAPGLLFLQSFTYIGGTSSHQPSPLVPIVVGVVGGVLLIAAIGLTWFCLRRRSRRRREAEATQTFDDHQEAYFAPTPFVPNEVAGTNAAPLLSAEANESTSYFPMTQRLPADPFADKSRSELHLANPQQTLTSPAQEGMSGQISPSVLHGLVQGLVDRGVPGDTITGAIQGAMMEAQPRTSISQTTNFESEGSRTTDFTSPPPYHLKN